MMDPLDPPNDSPDPTITVPLAPKLALPVLNTRTPLSPDTPAFDVEINTLPLVDKVPNPEDTVTFPPVP